MSAEYSKVIAETIDHTTAPLTVGSRTAADVAINGAAGAVDKLVTTPFDYLAKPVTDVAGQGTSQFVDIIGQAAKVGEEKLSQHAFKSLNHFIDAGKVVKALHDGDPYQAIKEAASAAASESRFLPAKVAAAVLTTVEMAARAGGMSDKALAHVENPIIKAALSDTTMGLPELIEGMYRSSDGGTTWHLREQPGTLADGLRRQPFGPGLLGTSLGLLGKLVALIAAALLTLGAAFCASANLRDPARARTGSFGVTTGGEPVRPQGGYDVEKSDSTIDGATMPSAPPVAGDNVPGWEASLQRDRLNRIVNGDINQYNQFLKDHADVYREHSAEACASGFYAQGCGK